MSIIIKNVDSVSHTYAGQMISAGGQYYVPTTERAAFANDDDLLEDIANGLAVINDGSSDISGTTAQINYLKDIRALDTDGALLSRPKFAVQGWSYQMRGIEFETSKLGSLKDDKINMSDFSLSAYGHTSIKFFDASKNELTTQGDCDTSCIFTQIDFEPNHDMEIIGGKVYSLTDITEELRLWIIGVPDVPEGSGGSKAFVANLNMNFLPAKNELASDGRTTKRLNYNSTYHTSKMRSIFKHPAGSKYRIQILFELFKP